MDFYKNCGYTESTVTMLWKNLEDIRQ
jgi:hypothetical protein